MCKKHEQAQKVAYEKRKTSMVNAQVVSSKGMYIYKCECYIWVHLHAYVIEGISIR